MGASQFPYLHFLYKIKEKKEKLYYYTETFFKKHLIFPNNNDNIIHACRCGGIGRRTGLKIPR